MSTALPSPSPTQPATGLSATFQRSFPGGPVVAVQEWRAAQSAGVTVLFGPSGSGKTTLLRCLAGLDTPRQGHIRFNDAIWFDADRKINLPPRERQIGFVPQNYALFPHLTVFENITYGVQHLSMSERTKRLATLLQWLDLNGLEQRRPLELSGGQQQRVALARAVIRQPRLLLLDEPLSALDAPTRARVRAELRNLLRQLQIPAIVVTHDRLEAVALGDELVILHEGRIVQQGPVHEVFSRPANLAAAGVVTVETIQPGRVSQISEGLATVAVGSISLIGLAENLPPTTTSVHVCIRAEDVILTRNAMSNSSPRNRLSATVRALSSEGPMIRIDLDCGFPLVALLTRQAGDELELAPGAAISVMLKAHHVHLIPR